MTQVNEDGSESPLDGELAAALAGPAGQFSEMIAWAAQEAAGADHGKREKVIGESGRELQRQLLEATFTIDCAREERVGHSESWHPDILPRRVEHDHRTRVDETVHGQVMRRAVQAVSPCGRASALACS